MTANYVVYSHIQMRKIRRHRLRTLIILLVSSFVWPSHCSSIAGTLKHPVPRVCQCVCCSDMETSIDVLRAAWGQQMRQYNGFYVCRRWRSCRLDTGSLIRHAGPRTYRNVFATDQLISAFREKTYLSSLAMFRFVTRSNGSFSERTPIFSALTIFRDVCIFRI